MTNLLRANVYRLRRTLVFWGGLAASAGFGAFIVYARVSDYHKYGGEILLDQIFFIYTVMAGFLLSIVASTILGTEYSNGTVRNKLTVGHLRRDVYLANLISMICTSWLYCGTYILVVTALGAPFAGWLTVSGKLIAVTLLGSLLLETAFCALYTCVSMNCSHKAATAIICILLFFAFMIASTYVYNMLEAPPEWPSYQMSLNGEIETVMVPNPHYLEGTERAVYEFLFDLLPTGQAVQYYIIEFAHPLRMMLCSVFLVAASTLGGMALFRRKDLK